MEPRQKLLVHDIGELAGIRGFVAIQHAVDIQKDDLHAITLQELRSARGHTYQSAASTIAAAIEAAGAESAATDPGAQKNAGSNRLHSSKPQLQDPQAAPKSWR